MEPGFPHKYLLKPVAEKTRLKNIAMGVCVSWGCKRPSSPETRHYRCATCRSRLHRLRNPKRYVFDMIRDSARKRNIPFLLTFAELLEFDKRTNYFSRRNGQDPEGLTIDRIDPSKPYQADNIRALKWIDNCNHTLEGMKEPWEPIARELAKGQGNEKSFWAYKEEALAVLAKVLKLIEAQTLNEDENEEDPF